MLQYPGHAEAAWHSGTAQLHQARFLRGGDLRLHPLGAPFVPRKGPGTWTARGEPAVAGLRARDLAAPSEKLRVPAPGGRRLRDSGEGTRQSPRPPRGRRAPGHAQCAPKVSWGPGHSVGGALEAKPEAGACAVREAGRGHCSPGGLTQTARGWSAPVEPSSPRGPAFAGPCLPPDGPGSGSPQFLAF